MSHASLQLCEIDLGNILPSESLAPFMDEIRNREKQRKQLARKVCLSPSYQTMLQLSETGSW